MSMAATETRRAGATRVTPVLPIGRTDLSDTVYAVRSPEEVRVIFDTQMGRTRRLDKFELMVRTTLPRIFGAPADSALAAVPYGEFARDGDLINELPTRGITLTLGDSGAIVLWPETRPGRDGPLVVAYRAVVR